VLRAYVDHGFEDVPGGVRLKCHPEHEATIYEMATAHDAFCRLREVACPVIVVCGSATEGCTPARARAHASHLPSGCSEVLRELSHFGPMERPDAVASSIRTFFAGLRARSS
jgi:pimeloyl-ACP methyl ester carboxylesterase